MLFAELVAAVVVLFASASHLPDLLRGPPLRPGRRYEVGVGRGRIRRRAQLDQVLDLEAVPAEQADPGARWQDPVDRAVVEVHAAQRVVVEMEPARLAFLLAIPREVDERVGGAEREQATRAQHTGDLGHRPLRIAEAHRAVIAEHRVEAGGRERQLFRAREDEVDWRVLVRAVVARVAQLARRRGRVPSRAAPRRVSAADHCAAPQPNSSTARPATSPRTSSSASGRRNEPQASARSARSVPCAAWYASASASQKLRLWAT